jgi:hypothetical protein
MIFSIKSLGIFLTVLFSASFLAVEADPQIILSLVNQARSRAGCPPVTLDARLMKVAERHNNFCVRRNELTHFDPEGDLGTRFEKAGYKFSKAGENIASGFGDGEDKKVMDAWMRSPGHRANILNCAFCHLGVACSNSFWTQEFGATLDSRNDPVDSTKSHSSPHKTHHRINHRKKVIRFTRRPDRTIRCKKHFE